MSDWTLLSRGDLSKAVLRGRLGQMKKASEKSNDLNNVLGFTLFFSFIGDARSLLSLIKIIVK